MKLQVIVIHSGQIDVMRSFYEMIGFRFQSEQHDTSPVHYATILNNGAVLELYPPTKEIERSQCQLVFLCDKLNSVCEKLIATGYASAIIRQTHALVKIRDPDGNILLLHT